MNKIYFYMGKKINLRGIKMEDYTEGLYRWANDPDFNRYLTYGIRVATKDSMGLLYNGLIKKDNVIFAIVNKKDKTIGLIGLHHLDYQLRSAEYTIHIEKAFWGSGAASEATDFILRHAFNTLNMNKIWLGVAEPNLRALAFYRKKGFIEEGRIRDGIYREGRYFAIIRMGILRRRDESY